MERKKAIIVDDEQSARDVLSNLLKRYCPNIEVLAQCCDVPSAVKTIKELNPDLVFLDIEMPDYMGFEIISFFEETNFDIIFVTAYDHYAVKAFEVSAIDYLLKPVEITRLQDAVSRFEQQHQLKNDYNTLIENLKSKEVVKLVIPFQGGKKIIALGELVAIEAKESYSMVWLLDGTHHIVSKNLGHFESVLEDNPEVFRSHKSWIINLKHVDSYSKNKLEITLETGIVAKLSKYKKIAFEDTLT